MPDNAVFCSRCGAQNPAVAQFCQTCGAGLTRTTSLTSAASAAPPAPAVPAVPAPPAAVAYASAPVVPGPSYGGFWIRVVAYVLDSVVLSLLFVPLAVIFLLPGILKVVNQPNVEEPPLELIGGIFLMVPLLWIAQWLYEALTTSSSWQGTLGKRVLRLKVTDEAGNKISFGRATGRFFGKILSSMIMNIGFIMVAFTDRKQGLHDMIAGTIVTRY